MNRELRYKIRYKAWDNASNIIHERGSDIPHDIDFFPYYELTTRLQPVLYHQNFLMIYGQLKEDLE